MKILDEDTGAEVEYAYRDAAERLLIRLHETGVIAAGLDEAGPIRRIELMSEKPAKSDPDNAVRFVKGRNLVHLRMLARHMAMHLGREIADERVHSLARTYLGALRMSQVGWFGDKAARGLVVPRRSVRNITITLDLGGQTQPAEGLSQNSQPVEGQRELRESDFISSNLSSLISKSKEIGVANALPSAAPPRRESSTARTARHRAKVKAEATPPAIKAARDAFEVGEVDTYLGHDRAYWSTATADHRWLVGLD